MFGLKKKPFNGKEKRYSVTFDKFGFGNKFSGGAGRLAAESSVNCDCGNGTVSAGLGLGTYKRGGYSVLAKSGYTVRKFFVIDTAETLDDAPASQLHCILENGTLQSYDDGARTYVHQISVSLNAGMVCVADEAGNKRTVFSGEGEYCTRTDGSWVRYSLTDATTAICACKNRVFIGLKKATVAYSDPSLPWSFTSTTEGGGRIRLAYDFGEIVALLCFENRVYVFHQFGVARMDVEGLATDFKVQPLDYAGGEIYGASVGVCGNVIFFLAADGVYRFDGKKFYRVDAGVEILPSLSVKTCAFGVCGGKYILQYTDRSGTKRGVAISSDGKSGYFVDVREGLSQCGGVALCRSGSYVKMLLDGGALGSGETRKFSTRKTDFGVRGRKYLRALRLVGEGSLTAYVYGDGFLKYETLYFYDGVASMDVGVAGEAFSFTFYLNDGACLREITADISVPSGK